MAKPLACVAKPGSSVENLTGKWRGRKPIVDGGKCVKCGVCQNFCPEGVMGAVGKIPEIDFDYCKGCGLCAATCPVKCIRMVEEKTL